MIISNAHIVGDVYLISFWKIVHTNQFIVQYNKYRHINESCLDHSNNYYYELSVVYKNMTIIYYPYYYVIYFIS